MAAFEKGHEKAGGRKKGTPNNVTIEVKAVIDLLLPPAELERRWRKLLDSRNPCIALRAFELALMYRYGKPKSNDDDGDPANRVPTIIDISAMPLPKLPII